MATSAHLALAALLPLLLAGEESAEAAFEVLSRRRCRGSDRHALGGALRAIAAEERVHQQRLLALQSALPAVPDDPALRSRATAFFAGLASRNVGIHLTRIAALDSAVCLLLGALRRAQPALHAGVLAGIGHDEARHVAVTLAPARALSSRSVRLEAAVHTRVGLAALLGERAASLDQLGIDPDRLLRRVAEPPGFLIAGH
jgi:hypothetical protein